MKSLQCSAQRFGEPQAHLLPDICFRSLFLRGSHTNSTLQLTISYPSPPTQFTQNLPVDAVLLCAAHAQSGFDNSARRMQCDQKPMRKSGLYSFVHTLISVSGPFSPHMLRTSFRSLTTGTNLLRSAPKASGVGRGPEAPAHACGWQDSGMRRWPAGQQLNYGGRSGQHARVCAGTTVEEKSRSIVHGTQESDWTVPPAPAEIKVCSGAVLPGGGQNIKRLVQFLSQPTTPVLPATT
jgi:hypothetical protein